MSTPEPETERHEVSAYYDNIGAQILNTPFATPVLHCSCNYATPTVETWAEAGEFFDGHLIDVGLRDD